MKTIERKMMTVRERVERLGSLSRQLASLRDDQRSADAQDIAFEVFLAEVRDHLPGK